MTLTIQLQTMFAMTFTGVYLGMAIDTYERLAKKRPTFHLFILFNDLLFWLTQSLLVFLVLLYINHGEVRFYIFIALFCGFAAYKALFQGIYLKLLELSITIFTKTTYFFYRLIFEPIKFILKLLYSLCMMIVTILITPIIFILKLFAKPFVKGRISFQQLMQKAIKFFRRFLKKE